MCNINVCIICLPVYKINTSHFTKVLASPITIAVWRHCGRSFTSIPFLDLEIFSRVLWDSSNTKGTTSFSLRVFLINTEWFVRFWWNFSWLCKFHQKYFEISVVPQMGPVHVICKSLRICLVTRKYSCHFETRCNMKLEPS